MADDAKKPNPPARKLVTELRISGRGSITKPLTDAATGKVAPATFVLVHDAVEQHLRGLLGGEKNTFKFLNIVSTGVLAAGAFANREYCLLEHGIAVVDTLGPEGFVWLYPVQVVWQ
jgi:hypothetical protein